MSNQEKTPAEHRADMSKKIAEEMQAKYEQGRQVHVAQPAPVGNPLAPAPEKEEKPAPKAPTAKESKSEKPAEELIFGKYKSMEEAEKGYYESVKYANSAMDELSAIKNQASATPGSTPAGGQATTAPGGSPGARERVDPSQRNLPPVDWRTNEAVVKVSEETGIPVDQLGMLADAIRNQSAREAQEVVDARLTPMQAQADAEAYMRKTYPDAYNHLDEMSLFLKGNPGIAQVAGSLAGVGDQRAAMEYVWTQYRANIGRNAQAKMQVNAEVAEEQRVEARAAAGLPAATGTSVHAALAESNGPTQEQLAALLAARKAGDQQAAILHRRATLGHLLPPELTKSWETGR